LYDSSSSPSTVVDKSGVSSATLGGESTIRGIKGGELGVETALELELGLGLELELELELELGGKLGGLNSAFKSIFQGSWGRRAPTVPFRVFRGGTRKEI
jgi:hypothetical protein